MPDEATVTRTPFGEPGVSTTRIPSAVFLTPRIRLAAPERAGRVGAGEGAYGRVGIPGPDRAPSIHAASHGLQASASAGGAQGWGRPPPGAGAGTGVQGESR